MKLVGRYFFMLSIMLFLVARGKDASGQESCKVLMTAISDHYEGDCKKGKASGNGKAEGTDQYIGEFKNGLPHGSGLYRWKNGDFYEGKWANGKREGAGGMSYKRSGKTDSLVTGFWKKGVYSGIYDKPFVIHFQSIKVIKVEVIKNTKQNSNAIVIEVQNTTGGTATLGGGLQARAEVTDIDLQKGSFGSINKALSGPKSTSQILGQVDYPFRAIFKFGDQQADIEILEAGYWKIFVNINN
jgi:hypothetical protein